MFDDELKGNQYQVLVTFSISKNPSLLPLRPDTRYIELILVFHKKNYYIFDRIEYLHNQGFGYGN